MSYVGRQEEKSAPVICGLNVSFRLLRMVGSAATELDNGVPFSAASAERLIEAIGTSEEVFYRLDLRTRALNVSALQPRPGAAAKDRRRSLRLCLTLENLPAPV